MTMLELLTYVALVGMLLKMYHSAIMSVWLHYSE